MTVSFHQFGNNFFPGSGDLKDVGERRGKFYSLNVPLQQGTTDATFHSLFKPIVSKVVEIFNPSAIVLQCGELDCPPATKVAQPPAFHARL